MTALIETAEKAQVRQLIFEAQGGVLTEAEARSLEEYLTFSVRLHVGTIHGKMCCAWGLVPPSLLANRAYLWLYSTEAVEDYKFLFIRNSQRAIEDMLTQYPIIYGHCALGHDRSIRWVRWLGGVFGEPTQGFLPFEIRKR